MRVAVYPRRDEHVFIDKALRAIVEFVSHDEPHSVRCEHRLACVAYRVDGEFGGAINPTHVLRIVDMRDFGADAGIGDAHAAPEGGRGNVFNRVPRRSGYGGERRQKIHGAVSGSISRKYCQE